MLQVKDELRAVEEILLLILDHDNGEIRNRFPRHFRAVAFAGAALMDLALQNRIDTNADQLIVSEPTPLGDELLDPILAEIAQSGDNPRSAAFWIAHLARQSDQIREMALTRLIERGYLEADAGGQIYLSPGVSRVRRYTTPDGRTTEEVHLRIMRTLFSDDIPDPRDIVIISLAAASGVFESILSQDELAQVQGRIDLICRMDLIGREVTAATNDSRSFRLHKFLTTERSAWHPLFTTNAAHYLRFALIGLRCQNTQTANRKSHWLCGDTCAKCSPVPTSYFTHFNSCGQNAIAIAK